jgi:hypothetical protein
VPYVMIDDEDFKKLSELAGIFDVKDVVSKVLDHYLESYTSPDIIQPSDDVKKFDFENVPNLSHAKFLFGKFDDVASSQTSWKGLMEVAFEVAFKRLGSFEKLAKVNPTNIVEGKKTDEGYYFLSDLGFSYQGVSAVYAAKSIGALAKEIRVPVKIEFRWRQKDEALHPGEAGQLTYSPDKP